jgi:hypothetical protein
VRLKAVSGAGRAPLVAVTGHCAPMTLTFAQYDQGHSVIAIRQSAIPQINEHSLTVIHVNVTASARRKPFQW